MIEEQKYNLVKYFAVSNRHIYKHIHDWDVKEALSLIEDTSPYYGFMFERRLKIIERQKGLVDINIRKIKSSPTYYINCYIETIDDLKVKPKPPTNLIAQLINLGTDKVVHNIRNENLTLSFPLMSSDIVLDEKGNVIDV